MRAGLSLQLSALAFSATAAVGFGGIATATATTAPAESGSPPACDAKGDSPLVADIQVQPDQSRTWSVHAGTYTASGLLPPIDFRPETAAPAELARFGFPPAPAGSEERASWLSAMQAYHT